MECLSYDEILNKLALPPDIYDLLDLPLKSLGFKLQDVTGHDPVGKPFKYYQVVNGGASKPLNLLFIESLQDKGCVGTIMSLGYLFQKKTNSLVIFSKGEYVHPAYNEIAKMWKDTGPEDVKLFSSFEIGQIETVKNNPQEAGLKVKEYIGLPDGAALPQVGQPPLSPLPPLPPPSDVVKIFISYSHKDEQYLADDSLIGYLSALKQQKVEFWWDGEIPMGSKWDEVIKQRISQSHIALMLISYHFLNSEYCSTVEIPAFLQEAEKRGLQVFPIMLSPCPWKLHAWLKARKFIPEGEKTILKDYRDEGDRLALFNEILEKLLAMVETIRGTTPGAPGP